MLDNKILLAAPKHIATAEIESYLVNSEYDVTLTDTIFDTSECLYNESYSLVLVYIDFVSEILMSVANNAGVPVMCLTEENITHGNVADLYSLGCADYVTLPVNRSVLLARVKNQIEVKADELMMHSAKDYLYDFAVSVSHDIKNQFTVSAQLSEWLIDSDNEQIDEKSKIILSYLASLCTKTRHMIESIEDRTVNESRHRGGFIRHTADLEP